jgi:AcrR family transcriptional regulator
VSPDRLDRDAWVSAGLDALEHEGVSAVAAAPLARRLGVTRGSFYWHFASRNDLLEAVVRRWEREHSDDLLDALEGIPDPRVRLVELVTRAVGKPPSFFVRLLAASEDEPIVSAALRRSADRRMAVMATALRELGLTTAEARRRALLVYSGYVGSARMYGDDPDYLSARERAAYARHVIAALIPD